jgi:hypothetical protein
VWLAPAVFLLSLRCWSIWLAPFAFGLPVFLFPTRCLGYSRLVLAGVVAAYVPFVQLRPVAVQALKAVLVKV